MAFIQGDPLWNSALRLGEKVLLSPVIPILQQEKHLVLDSYYYCLHKQVHSAPLHLHHAAAAKSLQSCLTLCDPIDSSPPGSPVPGILQAGTLEWVVIAFSNAWKWKVKVKSLSCIRLSDPMDCILPGPSVHGIFQARVLEWGAIAFSNSPS